MASARRESDEAKKRKRAAALQRWVNKKQKSDLDAERAAAAEERKRLSARKLVMTAGLVAWRHHVDAAIKMREEGLDGDEIVELLRNRFAKAA